MARIPLADEGSLTPEQRKVFDAVVAGPRGMLIGPLRAALHRPDLADVWQRFGAMLRYGTSLPRKFSELAIIVTAKRWCSQLEWEIHAKAAVEAGLPTEIIEAIKTGRAPVFEERPEYEIYEFTRELQLTGQVGDETYAAVRKRWGTVGVVELTTLVGYYTLVSMTLNAHQIPLPDGMEATLPTSPDGTSSAALADIPGSELKKKRKDGIQ